MGRLLRIAHQTEYALLDMEQFKGPKPLFRTHTGANEIFKPMPTIFGDSAFKLSFYNDAKYK